MQVLMAWNAKRKAIFYEPELRDHHSLKGLSDPIFFY